MFENKEVNGILYSRYIASWRNCGGQITYGHKSAWYRWLESMDIPEEIIWDITNMALCGKMELEDSAKKFLANEK